MIFIDSAKSEGHKNSTETAACQIDDPCPVARNVFCLLRPVENTFAWL